MPAGLHVTNDAGEVLIDATYQNFAEVAAGTAFSNGNGQYAVSVSGATPSACVAVAPGAVPVRGGALNQDNGDGTYTVRFATALGDAGPDMPYRVFSVAPPASAESGIGLQVFNEAGALCFDSAQRYLRVAHVAQVDATHLRNNGLSETFAHPSIPNAYYLLSCINGIRVTRRAQGVATGRLGVRQDSPTQSTLSFVAATSSGTGQAISVTTFIPQAVITVIMLS